MAYSIFKQVKFDITAANAFEFFLIDDTNKSTIYIEEKRYQARNVIRNFVDAFIYSDELVIPLAVDSKQSISQQRYTDTIWDLQIASNNAITPLPVMKPKSEEFNLFYSADRVNKLIEFIQRKPFPFLSWLELNNENFIIEQTGTKRIVFYQDLMDKIQDTSLKNLISRGIDGFSGEDIAFLLDMAAKYTNYSRQGEGLYVSHNLRSGMASTCFGVDSTDISINFPVNWGDAFCDIVFGSWCKDKRKTFIDRLCKVRDLVRGNEFRDIMHMEQFNKNRLNIIGSALKSFISQRIPSTHIPKENTLYYIDKFPQYLIGALTIGAPLEFGVLEFGVTEGIDLIEHHGDYPFARKVFTRIDSLLTGNFAEKYIRPFVTEAPFKINEKYFR